MLIQWSININSSKPKFEVITLSSWPFLSMATQKKNKRHQLHHSWNMLEQHILTDHGCYADIQPYQHPTVISLEIRLGSFIHLFVLFKAHGCGTCCYPKFKHDIVNYPAKRVERSHDRWEVLQMDIWFFLFDILIFHFSEVSLVWRNGFKKWIVQNRAIEICEICVARELLFLTHGFYLEFANTFKNTY